MVRYDYIIAGAGAAGLSLVMRMIASGQFAERSILLVDKAPKNDNDRTWCFWEKGEGFFEEIVFKQWDHLSFYNGTFSRKYDIAPYQYKLIRGIDFYRYCLDVIMRQPNIVVRYGEVTECFSDHHETGIVIGGERVQARYVFNSILFNSSILAGNHHYLLQHFKGWFLKTAEPAFDSHSATLMDFRTPQVGATTFLYMMPFSDTEALVEYTLFSKKLLDDSIYDDALERYCKDTLHLKDYNVVDQEFGIIPMTTYPFQRAHHSIINIGTAGGQTKSSTGYTFQFIQVHTAEIVKALVATGRPFIKKEPSKRFRFYDAVLLNILANNKIEGHRVFAQLMEKNDLRLVMKFLDNETNFAEELYLVRHLPKKIFLRAAREEWAGF